ncbi:AP endonuclease [Oceanobacillus arenosus]|uniref:AP endonuclease n=1 Tax=Oceanobacillus arenosus TaxID=1229153 RepID=A0A3D8PIU3_9BACI|nr:sugar phosphate isomerase/epimerase family protein [Oceanobacillus arenosus]RDW16010.1 AP endonuclease [Oceanobacillus arenosus]
MFKVGLCSVTFRNLSVEAVINAAKESQIQGIEWGGDIHVPPGNLENAEKVATLTKDAGMEIISYGSYYRLGDKTEEVPFQMILATATNLEAPAIRVWAGKLGSDEATEDDWQVVIKDARRIADLAKEKDIRINLEYHGRTLTDTVESATRLLKEINHDNVSLYWQPALFETVEERVNSIGKIRPWLSHVHVFYWEIINSNRVMYPFSEGVNDWKKYLAKLGNDNGVRYLMMEFVKNGSLEQFREDVETLRGIIE